MTEKFWCCACARSCYLEITFNEGDEKTKAFLICPLAIRRHSFTLCDKTEGIIKTENPNPAGLMYHRTVKNEDKKAAVFEP